MEFFQMDYDLSKDMYEECKHLVEMKGCYSNVAKIFLDHVLYEEDLANIEMVFGAWEVPVSDERNIYAKHCFFLLDNKIIDPTYFTTTKKKENRRYLIFKKFGLQEYMDKLNECKGDTSLDKYTYQMFNDKTMELLAQNIFLIG